MLIKTRGALVLALAVTTLLASPAITAQSTPKLAGYFTVLPTVTIDPDYTTSANPVAFADLNGDGNQDMVALGATFPGGGATCCVPQPGRVFFGDGDGHFSIAPSALFPVDTLKTVFGSPLFADFNGDGRLDMFIACAGWDGEPFPGEQNRLFLSLPDGGWRDATNTLPQLADYSLWTAAGDISHRGIIDLFVGTLSGGQNPTVPYTLLNSGSGQFTLTRSNIPAGKNGLLDTSTLHYVTSATFTDLDGDSLPELVVTSHAGSANPTALVFWNHAGTFAATDITALPVPTVFADTRWDAEAEGIDVNKDGLRDLVLVGTPSGQYNGWFLQILVNKGNHQFADETAARLTPEDTFGGAGGSPLSNFPEAGLTVIDFNQDGAPDFFVEFQSVGKGDASPQSMPLIWINDGTGHFSTLKVGDFVAPGKEFSIGPRPHLVKTRNGYSFIAPQFTASGLRVTGLLASKRKLPGVGR